MHKYLQKFFLIYLFFCISLPIQTMQDINVLLTNAVIRAENNNLDLQKIKEYIEGGANPNCKAENGASLVCTAVLHQNIDLLKCLIQGNANVNSEDNPLFIPLKCAVDKLHENGLEMVKELCNAGASLILRDFSPESKITIFHHLIMNKTPKKAIETIITHARFYNQIADEQLKKQIITSLLVFNRLSTLGFSKLPQEIKFRILSHLVLDFSSGFNERFRKKLIEMNCNDFIFPYVEKRVENIDKILQFVDRSNITSTQGWVNVNGLIHKNNAPYDAQVQSLLDGSKLRNDMIDFKNSFPEIDKIPENNLILKICDAQKLLEIRI